MKCPQCNDVTLVMAERQGVEIDYCTQCRGVWLDRGELDKLIERSACADDRRSYRLSVTPGGGALAREATKRIVAAERSRSGLTPGEQAILAELLHKIACARQAVAQTQASSAEGVAP